MAFHILHLHSQVEDFSFLMVDLGLCFLHVFLFTLPTCLVCLENELIAKPNHFSDDEEYGNMGCGVFKRGGGKKSNRPLPKNQQKEIIKF